MSKKINKKMANSFVGRVLRRLLGEEAGAVMMEYIVIALLIASVAVVAISAFGSQIQGLFGVIGLAAGGRSTAAVATLNDVDTVFDNNHGTAKDHAEKIQDEKMQRADLGAGMRGGAGGGTP